MAPCQKNSQHGQTFPMPLFLSGKVYGLPLIVNYGTLRVLSIILKVYGNFKGAHKHGLPISEIRHLFLKCLPGKFAEFYVLFCL